MANRQRIPTFAIALTIAAAFELALLMIGGFRLGIGPTGPDNALLFFTHFPAMLLCSFFAMLFRWLPAMKFEVAVAIVNALLIWAVLFVLIRWMRKQREAR